MLKAYAKINMILRVTGLQNNYHTLEMLNAKIKLHDSISIKKANKTRIIYDKLKIKKQDDTLYKMIMDLKYIYPNIPNILVKIKKRIPVQAGLGGMSSDAAVILQYLNHKYDLGLGLKEMKIFLLNYGTDMCYALYNTPCVVKGIGEIVKKVKVDIPSKIILIYPFIKISTKEIYEHVEIFSDPVLNNIEDKKWHELSTLFKNDLEDVVIKNNEEMKETLNNIRNIVKAPVVMSGSGSSIIVYDYNKKTLKKLKKMFPNYVIGKCKIIDKGE